MKKNAQRIIIYTAIIVVLAAATLICFLFAKQARTDYSSYNVQIITLTHELEKLTEGTAEYIAKQAEIDKCTAAKSSVGQQYSIFAYFAYFCSLAFLISIGVIVHHSSKVKELEDSSVTA